LSSGSVPVGERRSTARGSDVQCSVGQTPAASAGALLARGSVLQVTALLASVAVGFYLMPFLIHALGDRWYGIWALIGSITSYYGLLDLGLTSAVTRFLTQAIAREEDTKANAVIVTALVIFAGVGALVFLVSTGVALGAGWFLENRTEISLFQKVVLILGADVALAFPFAVCNALLGAYYRFDIASGIQLMALIVRTLLIVYFIGRGHSILALAVIALALSLLSRLALAAAAWRLFPSLRLSRAHFRPELAQELFGYGKYTFIAASADRLRFHVDTLIVASFLGVGLVTHYAVAARVSQLFMDLMIRALGVLGPVFMRVDAVGDREQMRQTFLLATRVSTLASVTVASGISIVGERFIGLWIGEAYEDAYWPLVILVVALTFDLMQMPSVSFLYASARHRFYAFLNAGEALANLVLSMMLVQHYGMIGVSLGTAIPLLVTRLIVQPRYVCRALALDLRLYRLEVGRAALLAALSQVPLLAFVHTFGVWSLPMMLMLVLGYYPLCWMLLYRAVLPKTDRRRISDAIPAVKWLPLQG
jgi:O-antigen/teichoic acid export membrane protein